MAEVGWRAPDLEGEGGGAAPEVGGGWRRTGFEEGGLAAAKNGRVASFYRKRRLGLGVLLRFGDVRSPSDGPERMGSR